MKKNVKKIYLQAKKRSLNKILGTSLRPRLSVFRSNLHIYAQLIDDKIGQTLVSCSTIEKKFLQENLDKDNFSSSTKEAAFQVGIELANRALKKEIRKIVFDRGKRAYHGRLKNLAEGAKQQGLIF
jgi:large subunit ribosomal protein L18